MSDTFDTVVGSLTMYGGLFKAIKDEEGIEKALKLHAAALRPFGDEMAALFKQELSGKEPNMKIFNESVVKPMMTGFGFDATFEADDRKVTVTVNKCPMYNAYVAAGLDTETIGKMCEAASASEFGRLNEFYPTVHGSVKPRKTVDDICIETFEIR